VNHIKKPNRKKKKQGSCTMLATGCAGPRKTYFRKLPPVKVVAGIIFKHKNVVDLVLVPDTAV
jgi:hypothetical protein